MKATLDETNFAFLFAQKYHAAMRFVGAVRKEIGIPTIFNILGPLANPAKANMQLFGVYKEDLVEPLTKVLMNLGVTKGMTVYGQDCLDEISLSAPTTVCEIVGDTTKLYEITPEQFGFARCAKEDLVGGTPEENAQIVRDILSGKEQGAKLDAVLLNAGAALHIARGITIEEGIAQAREAITSGKAAATLEQIIQVSNQ
jgi:anthranilate phosphoribosyltransferase